MAHRSRWGWHPCDYETFRLLKRLHAVYWRALRQFAAWQRWKRKLPHNRVLRRRVVDAQGRKVGSEIVGPMPEPPLHPLFCTRTRVVRNWTRDGRYVKDGETTERVAFHDHGIPDAYRAARKPAATEAEVAPLKLTAEVIRRMAREAEELSREKA